MKFLIITLFAAAAFAEKPVGGPLPDFEDDDIIISQPGYGQPRGYGAQLQGYGGGCGSGQYYDANSRTCIGNQVTQEMFFYAAPHKPSYNRGPTFVNRGVKNRLIFIANKPHKYQDVVVVGPPINKDKIYVVDKSPAKGQQVIHLPENHHEPEVVFVDGHNPYLPSAKLHLHDALRYAGQEAFNAFVGNQHPSGPLVANFGHQAGGTGFRPVAGGGQGAGYGQPQQRPGY